MGVLSTRRKAALQVIKCQIKMIESKKLVGEMIKEGIIDCAKERK
jgi:hypothetical protein